METTDQAKEITAEFVRIMKQLKQAQMAMKKLRDAGAEYRDQLGAEESAGSAALVHLELAEQRTIDALDEMVATCGAAKPDAIRAGGPFDCPSTAIHRPSAKQSELKAAA